MNTALSPKWLSHSSNRISRGRLSVFRIALSTVAVVVTFAWVAGDWNLEGWQLLLVTLIATAAAVVLLDVGVRLRSPNEESKVSRRLVSAEAMLDEALMPTENRTGRSRFGKIEASAGWVARHPASTLAQRRRAELLLWDVRNRGKH